MNDLEEYRCKDCIYKLLPTIDEKFNEWISISCPEQVVLIMCENAVPEINKSNIPIKCKCNLKIIANVNSNTLPTGKINVMMAESSYCIHRWIAMYNKERYNSDNTYKDLVESVKNKNTTWALQYLQSENKSWKHIAYAIVKGLID